MSNKLGDSLPQAEQASTLLPHSSGTNVCITLFGLKLGTR
jgi:hypothetical protein